MNVLSWKRVGMRLMSGLATCLLATGLYAQSPAAVGIVRVSDRPQQTQPRNAKIQQTSLLRAQTSVPHSASTGSPFSDTVQTASASSTTSTQSFPTSSCSSCQSGDCGSSGCGFGGCNSCGSRSPFDGLLKGGLLKGASDGHRSLLHHLFGYFIPDGCCGQGCPTFGSYNLNYSSNPRYFDKRDGGVYAAQGYNIPMAVPLAPNVRHTYNYGWGIPSSRLTPISTRAPF